MPGKSSSATGRPAVGPWAAWQALSSQRERIAGWLSQSPPLVLVRVQELLLREGVQASYTTLRRFVERKPGHRWREATVRLPAPPPGEEAQVDFGLVGWIPDEAGRLHKLHVLVVTLSHSCYQFVWPTYRQTTDELCAGLDAAWRFFDGVARRVVLDNASSMVVRASPTEPELNRTFREYADARGFLVDPARVRSPQDKARVEIRPAARLQRDAFRQVGSSSRRLGADHRDPARRSRGDRGGHLLSARLLVHAPVWPARRALHTDGTWAL